MPILSPALIVLILWTLVVWLVRCQLVRKRPPSESIANASSVDSRSQKTVVLRLFCRGDAHIAERIFELEKAAFGPHVLRVCAINAHDPVREEVSLAVKAACSRGCEMLCLLTPASGRNPKVAQIQAVVQALFECRYFLSVDADVLMASVNWAELINKVQGEGVGAVWQPFCSGPVSPAKFSLASRWEAAVLNGSQQTMALLARLDRSVMAGKVLAFSQDAVAAAGDWAGVEKVLGEDLALAQNLVAHGYRVEAVTGMAQTGRSTCQISDVFARLTRWVGIIVDQRPALIATYPLLFFYSLFLIPAWLYVFAHGAPGWLCCMGIAVTAYSRLGLGREARLACRDADSGLKQWVADALLSDSILLAAWLYALIATRRAWRGKISSRWDRRM